MKPLTPDQTNFVAIIEKSIQKLEPLQREASRIGFRILESHIQAIQIELRNALGYQLRTFRDNTLVDKEPLFPQGQFPYGKKIPEEHS